MELLQAGGDAGESLTRPLSRGRRGGGRWARGVCGHLGEGEGPRLGHAAPPPSSVPPRALCLSLLLPAVTGVPSPRATDPPSHVRPLFFPCIKPAGPSADPAPVSPSRFRDHPIWGFQAADTLHSVPRLPAVPRSRPPTRSRLGSPLIPSPTPSAVSRPLPRAAGPGWAPIGSPVPSLSS